MKTTALAIALSAILTIGCKSKPTLEGRVKQFMSDSVVPSMNDPKSYEYISMTADSNFSHQYASEIISETQRQIRDENSKFEMNKVHLGSEPDFGKVVKPHEEMIALLQDKIKRYKGYISRPDSLLDVSIDVKCRTKNKLGVLVVDDIFLKLEGNKITLIEKD